jgi:hypothetical protein
MPGVSKKNPSRGTVWCSRKRRWKAREDATARHHARQVRAAWMSALRGEMQVKMASKSLERDLTVVGFELHGNLVGGSLLGSLTWIIAARGGGGDWLDF